MVRRNLIEGWLGAPAETRVATEAWPMCTTMTAMGTESDWAQLDPDFAAGKKALAAEDWNAAIVALKLAVLRDPRNADIQNYIGYAYRRLRQLGPAMGHYQQALMLNPRHRSAREHLGELYLVLGESNKAEEHESRQAQEVMRRVGYRTVPEERHCAGTRLEPADNSSGTCADRSTP
jgi:tetratricopeptide (TPR) repeat protein